MARKKIEIVKIELDGVEVEAKECTKCGEVKALSEYGSNGKGGKRSDCKECIAKYSSSEKVKEQQRKYRKENKERTAERNKKYYQANKDKYRELIRNWQKANVEKEKERKRKHRMNNPDKYREYQIKYEMNNPESKALRRHKRRAYEKALPSTLTAEQTALLLSQGCALTGDKDDIHLDHFIPLAWGYGGTTFENMIPLVAGLNISKSASNPFEWIKTQQGVNIDAWKALVERLASLNGMTAQEYEKYVYYCEENKRDLTAEGA